MKEVFYYEYKNITAKKKKKAYVDKFKENGLSIVAFVRERILPSTTLGDWLRLDKALEFKKIDLVRAPILEQTAMKQIPHK